MASSTPQAFLDQLRAAGVLTPNLEALVTSKGLKQCWVDTDNAEAAAYLEQERIALRWAYNSEVEEI